MEQMQEMLVGAVPVAGRDRRGFSWSQCQEGTKTEGDAEAAGRQGQPRGARGTARAGCAQPAVRARVFTHRHGTAASGTGCGRKRRVCYCSNGAFFPLKTPSKSRPS